MLFMQENSQAVSEEAYDLSVSLSQLRERAEENQQDLDSRCYQNAFTRNSLNEKKPPESFGGFFLRTALCLLIFCGFLWLQKEHRSVLGVSTEAISKAVVRNVELQSLTDSVKMGTGNQ